MRVVVKAIPGVGIDGIILWVVRPFLKMGVLAEYVGKHTGPTPRIGLDAPQYIFRCLEHLLLAVLRLGAQQSNQLGIVDSASR